MTETVRAWLLLVLLACIWGSSFILMKWGMYQSDGSEVYSDVQVGSLRMTVAAAVLLPIALRSLGKIKKKKDILFLLTVGLLGNFIPAFLFTYAETKVSSGVAGILNSFTPIFTALLGTTLFAVQLKKRQLVGIAIGTVGLIALILSGENIYNEGSWLHPLAIVLATLFYGTSLNVIKHKLYQYKSYEITSLALFMVFLPALLIFWWKDGFEVMRFHEGSPVATSAVLVLGVVGTAVAVIVFNRIIALRDALFASSVTYFIPIVAVLIGFSIGETLNVLQILSMGIVLFGVALVNKKKKQKGKRSWRSIYKFHNP